MNATSIAVRRTGVRPRVRLPPDPVTTAAVSIDSATPRERTPPESRTERECLRALTHVDREAICRGPMRWRSDKVLSTTTAFRARNATVRRFVAALRTTATLEPRAIIVHRARDSNASAVRGGH